MRKKQSSTRRMAGSDDEEDLEATAAVEPASPPPPNGDNGTAASATATAESDEQRQTKEPEGDAAGSEAAATPVGARTRGSSGGGGAHVSPVSAPGIYDTVKCTACGKRVNPYNGTMQLHPMLNVLVCQRCYKFYRTGQFDIDHDGKENQCRWCGEGGSLICCDRCQHSFCKTCIRRNLGRSALQSVEELPDEAVWSCYMCDSAPLHDLQAEARVVMQAVRDKYSTEAARSRKQQQLQQQKLQQQKLQQQQRQSAAAALPAGGAFMGLKLDMSSVPKLPTTSAAMTAATAALPAGLTRQQQLQQRQRQQLLLQQQQQQQLQQQQRFAQPSMPRLGAAAPSNLALQRQQQQQLQQLQRLHQQQQQQLQQRQRAMAAAGGNSAVMTEQWYKKNVRIESILADIESVNSYNIGPALNATVALLQGMMRQYSRMLQDLGAVRTNQERAQVVSRFKSAYRMHLFLRLGKLRSLIAEQDRNSVRKSAAAPAGVGAAAAKPGGAFSVATALPQSSAPASMAAAAAALQLPGGGKTVVDAQGQPIPIAELLPELNRNIREMIERQNQARREAEAAAAAAASGVTIVTCSDADVEVGGDVGGEGDIVVLSDEEASSNAGNADGIAELLARRRQREEVEAATAGGASSAGASKSSASSRKKSQPRKITLPSTNRRISLAEGEEADPDSAGDNGDVDADYAEASSALAAAMANENGEVTEDVGQATENFGEAADDFGEAPGDVGEAPDNAGDAAFEQIGEASNDVGEAPGDDNNGVEVHVRSGGSSVEPFDSADAAAADVAAAVAAVAAAESEPFEPLWATPSEEPLPAGRQPGDESDGGGGGGSGSGSILGKRCRSDDEEEPSSHKRSRPQSPGSLETPPSSVTA